MNNTFISIIIPLYNSENWIEETIVSVLKQTYTNIEIIVVDDHSTDNSYSIVSNINSSKIKLVKNKKKGACAARNYGFELSKGDYIQYLDADDILSKDKISSQLNLLNTSENNTIVSCGWEKFTNNYQHLKAREQFINKSYKEPLQWLIDSWNSEEMGLISIWLTPRFLIQKVGGWNENLLINQDGDFFCRVLLQASKILYCEDALVYYRINPSSITQSKRSNKKLNSQLASYKMYETYLKEKLNNEKVKKALGNIYLKFIYHNDRNTNSNELIQLAWNHFNNLKIGKPWSIGKGKFKLIATVFGFKFALKIIRLFN